MARTDLIAPERTGELAWALWRSLHQQVLTLPDDLPVYPTHGAGSFCSVPAGAERTATIGREKAANPLLSAPDEDTFVTMLPAGLGSYPPYFLRLREVNRRGPAVHGPQPPPLAGLSVTHARRLAAEGALIVDVRPVAAFAAGHIAGSMSIPLRGQFATWLGWLADPGRPLVFILARGQNRHETVRQALKVGYENLAGELTRGIDTWREAGLPLRQIPLVPAAQARGDVAPPGTARQRRATALPAKQSRRQTASGPHDNSATKLSRPATVQNQPICALKPSQPRRAQGAPSRRLRVMGSRSLLTLCDRGAGGTCPGRPCRGRVSGAVLR